jgi:hypothetical protein
MDIQIIENITVKIESKNILKKLGYADETQSSQRINQSIDSLLIKADKLIKTQAVYARVGLSEISGNRIKIDDKFVIASSVLKETLCNCESVFLFIATIGAELESESSKLMRENNSLESLIMDAIGSQAAEALADSLCRTLSDEVKPQGLAVTHPFSPGYCDWNIEEQKILFFVLDGGEIKVKLTDSCMMIPRKSVSGIIGIGQSESLGKKNFPCQNCAKEKCPSRRRGKLAFTS